jgi:hypothetical protein
MKKLKQQTPAKDFVDVEVVEIKKAKAKKAVRTAIAAVEAISEFGLALWDVLED